MKIKPLFWILFGLNLLNYLDRQVLFSVFPLLQDDLHLTDFQLGTLVSSFMLVYLCYAPVMGYLADRFSRPRLIALSALVWSGATMACGFAKSYISLLIPRGLIGVGEGGFTTIAQPFLAENYPPEKHAPLLAAFGLALPIGSALGYVLGGMMGTHWGWRAAFMVVGVPGVFLAILALIFLKDNWRAGQTSRPALREYLPLLQNKPFLSVCFAQAMMTFVMGGLAAWMPTYLHRYLGVSVAQAGTQFGILVIVCGVVGTWLGGQLAAVLLKRTQTAYYKLIADSFLATLPCCGLALYSTHTIAVLSWMGLALTLLFMPTGAIAAALIATTPPRIRAMAFALNILIIHLLGDALSPTLIGWASDTWNLKTAVWLASLFLVPGTLFAWRAEKLQGSI